MRSKFGRLLPWAVCLSSVVALSLTLLAWSPRADVPQLRDIGEALAQQPALVNRALAGDRAAEEELLLAYAFLGDKKQKYVKLLQLLQSKYPLRADLGLLLARACTTQTDNGWPMTCAFDVAPSSAIAALLGRALEAGLELHASERKIWHERLQR